MSHLWDGSSLGRKASGQGCRVCKDEQVWSGAETELNTQAEDPMLHEKWMKDSEECFKSDVEKKNTYDRVLSATSDLFSGLSWVSFLLFHNFFFFHKSFSCHKSYNLVFLELKIFKFKFRFISPWIKDLYLKRKTIKLME